MKHNNLIKKQRLKIILFVLLIFNAIYVNSQISTIIQDAGCSDRLPPAPTTPIPDCDCDEGGVCHWICAGSPVLKYLGGITINECIIATDPNYNIISTEYNEPLTSTPYYGIEYETVNCDELNTIINSYNGSGYLIIYFPAGVYLFKKSININKSRIILKGAGGDSHLFNKPTHFFFDLPENAGTCINIIKNYIGIEDIYIMQKQLVVDDYDKYNTNTITINGSNCWIRGVESNFTRRFHIGIYGNYNTVSGCYFHDAQWYDDRSTGRAYGVCLSGNSEHNLIENNIFFHLRHSMVLQYGAKLNVVSYNYSSEPYGINCTKISGEWWECIDYSNRLADLLFHGQTPGSTENLCEGNYVEKIRLDRVHKADETNGPNNTFFRNLAEDKYQIFLDGFSIYHVPSDNQDKQYKQNVVGCNAKPSSSDYEKIKEYGFKSYWYKKNTLGTLIAEWQDIPPSSQYSYYKTGKPAFWYDWISWPYYPDGENPAKSRDFMVHNPPYNATEVVYAGWNLYKNMCGPCIYDKGIHITESPALQNNFVATEYITASYAITTPEKVTFNVGTDGYIELNPGFETYGNGIFEAYIDPTISCDFCNKMLLGDYYPGAQDHSTKESPKQKSEKEKTENKNNTVFKCNPNPFNNSTQIIFSIQETTNVRLYITNIYGTEILELVNNELSKGIHNINIKGSALCSGIYYCILETKDRRSHIKLVKL